MVTEQLYTHLEYTSHFLLPCGNSDTKCSNCFNFAHLRIPLTFPLQKWKETTEELREEFYPEQRQSCVLAS